MTWCVWTFASGLLLEDNGDKSIMPALVDCPAWKDIYGDHVSLFSRDAPCEDGTTQRVLMLAPYWKDIAEPDSDNYQKRMQGRYDAINAGWSCSVNDD